MSRVFFINSMGNGGAERVLSNILTSDDVLIQVWPDKCYEHNSLNVRVLLDKKKFLIWDLILSLFYLVKLVRTEKIDAINSHLYWANYLNTIASFITGHRAICTHCVSFNSKFKRKSVTRKLHSFLSKYILTRSYAHTYKSSDLMYEYLSLFDFKNNSVIYNPIEAKKCIDLSLTDVKEDFIFNQDKNYILSVGRFHETKNQLSLIKSLKYISETYEVIFLGTGEKMKECIDYANKNMLANRVHFIGQVTNPYFYYKNCDLYISTSLSEGFPNSLLEAIALNCYPISFDCETGPKEILSRFYKEQPLSVKSKFSTFKLGILLHDLHEKTIADSINYKFSADLKLDSKSREYLLAELELDTINSKYNTFHDRESIIERT